MRQLPPRHSVHCLRMQQLRPQSQHVARLTTQHQHRPTLVAAAEQRAHSLRALARGRAVPPAAAQDVHPLERREILRSRDVWPAPLQQLPEPVAGASWRMRKQSVARVARQRVVHRQQYGSHGCLSCSDGCATVCHNCGEVKARYHPAFSHGRSTGVVSGPPRSAVAMSLFVCAFGRGTVSRPYLSGNNPTRSLLASQPAHGPKSRFA